MFEKRSEIEIQIDKEIGSVFEWKGLDFLNNFHGYLPVGEWNGAYRKMAEESNLMDQRPTQENASSLYKSKTRREFFKDVDDAIVEAGLTNNEITAETDFYYKYPTMEAGVRWFKFLLPIYKNLRKKGYKHYPDLTG